jgi:hypothetical protein
MGLQRRDGYWLWVGGPVPPGAAAITIGSLISVRKRSAGSPGLLRHELVHVAQWRNQGVLGFLFSYLGSYLRLRLDFFPHKAAYRRIPQEVEASWLSRLTSGPIDMSQPATIFQ